MSPAALWTKLLLNELVLLEISMIVQEIHFSSFLLYIYILWKKILFSSLHFSHLYASGKVGLCESAVVGRGQWWEEEGEEDDYLGIWINLYLGNGNVWKVIIWGLLGWISKISDLELLGFQKPHLVHWGRRAHREEGEVGQHLAGVGWTDLEFH